MDLYVWTHCENKIKRPLGDDERIPHSVDSHENKRVVLTPATDGSTNNTTCFQYGEHCYHNITFAIKTFYQN